MGQVYLAVDETLGRRVALKSIRADRRLDPDARGRFIREARVLSQLDHPHICRVHDYLYHAGGRLDRSRIRPGRDAERCNAERRQNV